MKKRRLIAIYLISLILLSVIALAVGVACVYKPSGRDDSNILYRSSCMVSL